MPPGSCRRRDASKCSGSDAVAFRWSAGITVFRSWNPAEVDSPSPARDTAEIATVWKQVAVFFGLCECRFSVSARIAGEFCVLVRSLRASEFAVPTAQPQCLSARRRAWQQRVVGRCGNRPRSADRRLGSPKHPVLAGKRKSQPRQSPRQPQ